MHMNGRSGRTASMDSTSTSTMVQPQGRVLRCVEAHGFPDFCARFSSEEGGRCAEALDKGSPDSANAPILNEPILNEPINRACAGLDKLPCFKL